MSKSDFEFFYIVQRQKRKLPNWVLSTFGLRHTMGELLPIASRGNSGSQTRLNAPDQEAKAPLTTRGCWGGPGEQTVLHGTHLVQHCLLHSSLVGWELKDHWEHKALWNLCIMQPTLAMKSECLGRIQSEIHKECAVSKTSHTAKVLHANFFQT